MHCATDLVAQSSITILTSAKATTADEAHFIVEKERPIRLFIHSIHLFPDREARAADA